MKNILRKIQQKIYAIWRKAKQYISSFVGGQFKKRQILTNEIRKMILRFVNNIQEYVLTTYHIMIDFKTHEKKPTHYRLELLAELRSDLEKEILINQLKTQIGSKFDGCNHYDSEITTLVERNLIEKKFNDKLKNHVSMNFLFRQWVTTFQETPPIGYKRINVIDNTIPVNGVKDYRVNILKTGEIRFSTIKDMFCVEIETNEFKE